MAASESLPTSTVGSGGTVEPANRAAIAKEKFQALPEEARERFELRDPFAEVTYRSASFKEITAKAADLGGTRLTSIAADGKRTPMTLRGGEWVRGRPLPALLDRPIDRSNDRDEPGLAPSRPDPTVSPAVQIADASSVAVKDLARLEAGAEREALTAKLKAALDERYIIKRAPVKIGDVSVGQTEYRFRGDTSRIAFTESTFRLATDTNSPSVARSMVDVAQARNWRGIRVAGSEDFRRLIWLEASVRGVKAIGYEPNPADLDVLKRERDARQTNRIDHLPEATSAATTKSAEKSSTRGGGRKAVVAAIDSVLVSKGIPEARRQAVLAAATEQLAQRARTGQTPRVKVYDSTAPSRASAQPRAPEAVQMRDRSIQAPAR